LDGKRAPIGPRSCIETPDRETYGAIAAGAAPIAGDVVARVARVRSPRTAPPTLVGGDT